ncbi:MAG: mechanosensitive ion channel family protein [Cytophagales bacterium]
MNQILKSWHVLGQYFILENSLQNIAICLTVLFSSFLFKHFLSVQFNRFIYRFLRKVTFNVPVKEFVEMLQKPIEFIIILLLIYLAFSFIDYPKAWHLSSAGKWGLKMFINKGYSLILMFSIGWIAFRVIDFFAMVLKNEAIINESKVQEQLVPFMRQLVKLTVGIIFFFVILAIVFKVNVGAVITGLGIGGVAVALAGKETLENLLASFAIFVDKPFITGDLIKAAGYIGNVESVGFRTTRIRTLDKSLLTIPNKKLVDEPLENLSSRNFHRNKFALHIPFKTSSEHLKLIISKIQNVVKSHNKVNDNYYVFFENIGTYSLEITIIYNVEVVDSDEFWTIKEYLNYQIKEVMEEMNVDVDFPSSIVYLRDETNTIMDSNKQKAATSTLANIN